MDDPGGAEGGSIGQTFEPNDGKLPVVQSISQNRHISTVRPTRNRLLVATGVAACLVSLLLAALEPFVTFGPRTPLSNAASSRVLSLQIKNDEANPGYEPQSPDHRDKQLMQEREPEAEFADTRKKAMRVTPEETPSAERSIVDWKQAMAETTAAIGDEERRREESRSSMWQQTHSIMFHPSSKFELKELEPVIPDFRFKPEVHVVGLGLTIGSCFIGLPLAGVPVEDRTVAIRLFVCADNSG